MTGTFNHINQSIDGGKIQSSFSYEKRLSFQDAKNNSYHANSRANQLKLDM